MTIARCGGRRRDRHNGRPNKALERTAGSHSLAAAAHRRRSAHEAPTTRSSPEALQVIETEEARIARQSFEAFVDKLSIP